MMSKEDEIEYAKYNREQKDQMEEIKRLEIQAETREADERVDNHNPGFKVVALMGNMGVIIGMVSEPNMKRVYMCELCIEGRPSTEIRKFESMLKDALVNYIYSSIGDMPIDTILKLAAAEYNNHIAIPNSSPKWEASKLRNHFLSPLRRPVMWWT